MSDNGPSLTDPADKTQPDQTDNAGQTAVDPAGEGLVDAGEQSICESRPPDVGPKEAESKIDQLRAELEEAKDRALRTQAELENYRKRVARESQEARRYANMPLIRDLLPVLDNMGRAIEAAEKSHETASLLEGFKMVAGQLESTLARHHCTRIDALEKPFDPNLHEAVCQQPSRAHPVNTVLQVTQTGFRLHDRVVRPSQVIVSAAVPQTEGSAPGQQGGKEAEGEDKPEGGGRGNGTQS